MSCWPLLLMLLQPSLACIFEVVIPSSSGEGARRATDESDPSSLCDMHQELEFLAANHVSN